MKITKTKLRNFIREEIQKLSEKNKMSLEQYKKIVKKELKNKNDMKDQNFYDMMIDYFTTGKSPKELIDNWE